MMFGRKLLALSLVLILCFGTGTALAASSEEVPSEKLAWMTIHANATIQRLIEMTQQTGNKIVAAYDRGMLSFDAADATLQVLCMALRQATDAVIAPVIAQAEREGISWRCEEELVQVGWREILVDPIYVPGGAD